MATHSTAARSTNRWAARKPASRRSPGTRPRSTRSSTTDLPRRAIGASAEFVTNSKVIMGGNIARIRSTARISGVTRTFTRAAIGCRRRLVGHSCFAPMRDRRHPSTHKRTWRCRCCLTAFIQTSRCGRAARGSIRVICFQRSKATGEG